VVTPAGKRDVITHLMAIYQVSERRACRSLNIDRSLVRYQSIRSTDDPIRACLRALSVERKRFGYRRLHILLAREGFHLNHKKLRRLYKEEGVAAANGPSAPVRPLRCCQG